MRKIFLIAILCLVPFIGQAQELQALEPTYSRNIIKLQIINNQALFGVHSKSKSF